MIGGQSPIDLERVEINLEINFLNSSVFEAYTKRKVKFF